MYLKAVARFSPVMSPSSRRAWIEIDDCPELIDYAPCRPPRGGRGLKCNDQIRKATKENVALLAEGVD